MATETKVKWAIDADCLQACNCDYGCPCESGGSADDGPDGGCPDSGVDGPVLAYTSSSLSRLLRLLRRAHPLRGGFPVPILDRM